MTELRVATNEAKDRVEWHTVAVWDVQADNCCKYLKKGRTVLVEGRLVTRSWEDQTTKEKRYKTEVVASNVQFLGGGKEAPAETAATEPSMDIPF